MAVPWFQYVFLTAWKEGKATKENFDPLLLAGMNIIAMFIEDGGMKVFLNNQDVCPICEVDKGQGLARNWILGASKDQGDMARKMGWA